MHNLIFLLVPTQRTFTRGLHSRFFFAVTLQIDILLVSVAVEVMADDQAFNRAQMTTFVTCYFHQADGICMPEDVDLDVGTASIGNFRLCAKLEIFHAGETVLCKGRAVFLPIVGR